MFDMTSGLIGALSACAGMAISGAINWQTLRLSKMKFDIEKSKLITEIDKLSAETDRLRLETINIERNGNFLEKIVNEVNAKAIVIAEENRNQFYPIILELVYRIRNELVDRNRWADASVKRLDGSFHRLITADRLFVTEFSGGEIDGLWLLTDMMYKNRAFLEDEIFDKLHDFKRIVQNISSKMNVFTRPEDQLLEIDEVNIDKLTKRSNEIIEFESELGSTIHKVNALYEEISKYVRSRYKL